MSTNPNPISQDLKSLVRVPEPYEDGTIPVESIRDVVAQACPKLQAWWISSYNVVVSILPYSERARASNSAVPDPNNGMCRVVLDGKQKCPNKADFTLVTMYVTQLPPVQILNRRASNFCASCLYMSQSMALGEILQSSYFMKSEKSGDQLKPNGIYTLHERTDFLQTSVQAVYNHMATNDPAALQALIEKLQEQQQASENSG